MQDGIIKHDEQTELGEVGRYVAKFMYKVPVATEEDDLAGVSVLMKIRPDETGVERPDARKPKKEVVKRRGKRKTKQKKAAA